MMRYPSHPNAKIELGRRIYMSLGMCGNDSKHGLIVAMRGEPTGEKPRPGIMQIIRPGQMTFDVITFDGVMHRGCREHDVDRQAIGGIALLEKVHGPAMIARAHRLVAERDAELARQLAEAPHRMAEAQAATKLPDQLPHFVWNGVKDAKGGKLTPAYYSMGGYRTEPEGTIGINVRHYERFSDLVRRCFRVQNDTDLMTDYFDSDRIRVAPTHPLYPQVYAAWEAQRAVQERRAAKRGAR